MANKVKDQLSSDSNSGSDSENGSSSGAQSSDSSRAVDSTESESSSGKSKNARAARVETIKNKFKSECHKRSHDETESKSNRSKSCCVHRKDELSQKHCKKLERSLSSNSNSDESPKDSPKCVEHKSIVEQHEHTTVDITSCKNTNENGNIDSCCQTPSTNNSNNDEADQKLSDSDKTDEKTNTGIEEDSNSNGSSSSSDQRNKSEKGGKKDKKFSKIFTKIKLSSDSGICSGNASSSNEGHKSGQSPPDTSPSQAASTSPKQDKSTDTSSPSSQPKRTETSPETSFVASNEYATVADASLATSYPIPPSSGAQCGAVNNEWLAATQFWQHVMQTQTAVARTAPRKPNEIFKPYLISPEDELKRLQKEIQSKNQGMNNLTDTEATLPNNQKDTSSGDCDDLLKLGDTAASTHCKQQPPEKRSRDHANMRRQQMNAVFGHSNSSGEALVHKRHPLPDQAQLLMTQPAVNIVPYAALLPVFAEKANAQQAFGGSQGLPSASSQIDMLNMWALNRQVAFAQNYITAMTAAANQQSFDTNVMDSRNKSQQSCSNLSPYIQLLQQQQQQEQQQGQQHQLQQQQLQQHQQQQQQQRHKQQQQQHQKEQLQHQHHQQQLQQQRQKQQQEEAQKQSQPQQQGDVGRMAFSGSAAATTCTSTVASSSTHGMASTSTVGKFGMVGKVDGNISDSNKYTDKPSNYDEDLDVLEEDDSELLTSDSAWAIDSNAIAAQLSATNTVAASAKVTTSNEAIERRRCHHCWKIVNPNKPLSALLNHAKRHFPLKQFKCTSCNYSSSESAHVRNHMRLRHAVNDIHPQDAKSPYMQSAWIEIAAHCFPQVANELRRFRFKNFPKTRRRISSANQTVTSERNIDQQSVTSSSHDNQIQNSEETSEPQRLWSQHFARFNPYE